MTLLSYISYPTVDAFGTIKYIKIDLQNDKFFVNNEEIINMQNLINDPSEEDDDCDDCGDCCDDDDCDCNGDMYENDDLAFLPNMKENIIRMLERELEKVKISKDSEMEMEILQALKTLNEE